MEQGFSCLQRRGAFLLPACLPFLGGCGAQPDQAPLLRGTVTELWTIVCILLGGILIGAVTLITVNVLMLDKRRGNRNR